MRKDKDMFWENLITLCNKNGITPNSLCAKLGYSSATSTKWKNGSIPRSTTLRKLADYFGVTVEYLVGKEAEAPACADLPEDITRLTPHELDLIVAVREDTEKRRKVERILGIANKPKSSIGLTVDEMSLILAYRRTPDEQALIDKLLNVPDDSRGVLVYTAACSEDNRPDQYAYIDRDVWERIVNAPDSDESLI